MYIYIRVVLDAAMNWRTFRTFIIPVPVTMKSVSLILYLILYFGKNFTFCLRDFIHK